MNWIRLKQFEKSGTLVSVTIRESDGDASYTGYVQHVDPNFIVLGMVSEWHHDGLSIFRIPSVVSCDGSKLLDEQSRIVDWNCGKPDDVPDWPVFENDEALFRSLSLQPLYVFLYDGDAAEVGRISSVSSGGLVMSGVDAGGNILAEPITWTFDEIVQVTFGDEYSSTLYRYVYRQP
ncbi:hypothetical protein FF098_002915 [Parvularcula flava]|uniref:Uncharacterized protein n=1 Tax=Aquisalinus luteolus TaxID=1566827 RepID=A0A8J3A4P6_9PROT|nr:hypothetical protein [Aquisalinus luteolus]NHK26857.1 hypothetical protein [Aquisalinus luteolus]GGH93625.1 hypothetical protein GCM10011355_05900 [Aquisalinus luteolus]